MITRKREVALIGAGVMGRNHARVIASSPDAQLSLIIDPDEQTGKELAARLDTKWSPSLESIDSKMAVVMASPTEFHFEDAKQLINLGLDLLIEKPLTPTLAQSKALIELSENKGSVLVCGLLERFNPALITTNSLISEPIHVTATRHSPFTPRIRTHVVWDMMIHDIDIVVRAMNGTATEIVSKSLNIHSPNQVPDISEAIISFGGQGVASLSASRAGHRKIRKVSLVEIDRLFEVDLLRRNVTVYHNVAESPLSEGLGYKQESIIEIPELVTSIEPLTAQFNHFLELINREKDPDIERNSILPSHQIAERIAIGL